MKSAICSTKWGQDARHVDFLDRDFSNPAASSPAVQIAWAERLRAGFQLIDPQGHRRLADPDGPGRQPDPSMAQRPGLGP